MLYTRKNSTSYTISYQLMNPTTDNYTNILTVSREEHQTQTITCQADYGSGPIHAPNQLTIEGLDYYTKYYYEAHNVT